MKAEARILVCYNSPVSVFPVYNGKPGKYNDKKIDLSEYSFSSQMDNIVSALSGFFTVVDTCAVDKNITKFIENINDFKPDAILNLVESVEGISEYEYHLAGIYELIGYHYTGNIPSTLGNCLSKLRAKQILRSYGINTPGAIVLNPGKVITKEDINLNYPLILKLEQEDASIGISELSVVWNFKELKKHYKFLSNTYKKKILVEEYIVGRELNVAMLNGEPLPVSEIDFTGLPDGLPKIVTYDGKWIEDTVYYNHTKPVCPAKLDEKTRKKVEQLAVEAYRSLGCRDYARVDIRLTKNKVPFVIEVNPNPDISADSGFARAAAARGMNHNELLKTITNFALERKNNDTLHKAV